MPTPLVDMHCHLDLYPDPPEQISALTSSGAYVLSVTTTPRAWEKTAALARSNRRIKTALGLHPQLAAERCGELPLFDELLPKTRYVGEVGLDGSTECRPTWAEQMRVFDHVLASCAREGGKILTLHSRGAATAVLDSLDRHPGFGVAVLHWFSGTAKELQRAIESDCWFSVGSAMLKSKKGRELSMLMPPERVLTETDGPFGQVGGKALEPAECEGAIDALAQLWGIEPEAARTQVVNSFRTLISS